VHKFIHPNGSVLFVQQPKEAKDVAAFLAKEPRPMLAEPPTVSRGVMRLALGWLAFMLLAIIIITAFFLVGEERPDSVVRPALTARQRAAAFR
jgi:hypothetical protein